MNWIKIKDELPPMMEDVLLYLEDKDDVVAGWLESQPDEDPAFYSHKVGIDTEDATHWMPMPNPPVPFKSVCKE